jgi:competence protein ComFC
MNRRCLLCGKELDQGSFRDVFFSEDLLCQACRSGWVRAGKTPPLQTVPREAGWIYNEAFATALLQYKEVGDEALKDIFLQPLARRLRHRYRDYTLVLMPSRPEHIAARGFSHLWLTFAQLHLPMLEPFAKVQNGVQKGRSRRERLKMRQGILLKEGISLPHKLLLVDDVCTTGATLEGALRVLPEGHEVRIFTASIVPDFSRDPPAS